MRRTALALMLAVLIVFSIAPLSKAGQPQNSNSQTQREVTFTKDVAPIVFKECAYCHRPGEVAPFSLLSYREARPWARSIRQAVVQRKMPPWHADSHYGDYANQRTLTDKEIQTIVSWIDGGAVEGNPADLPAIPQFTDGWQIGTPDLVLSMKEPYAVPAKGTIPWVTLEGEDYEFKEDVWVQAIEVRPGNRAVVHHATVQGAGGTEYLHLYSPGIEPMIWRDGYGKLIKKGAKIQFQMHYQANGQDTTDVTKVGFVFAKKPVHTQVHTNIVSNGNFVIPPMAQTHEIITAFKFTSNARVHSLRPHMHLRAQNDTSSLITADGKRRVLLYQPKWEDAWQNFYSLTESAHVTPGAFIEYVASYDNSPANPVNPDPTQPVRNGQQLEEEMHVLYVTWTEDNPNNVNDLAPIQISPSKAYASGLLSRSN
jgi:hypothetical protein